MKTIQQQWAEQIALRRANKGANRRHPTEAHPMKDHRGGGRPDVPSFPSYNPGGPTGSAIGSGIARLWKGKSGR